MAADDTSRALDTATRLAQEYLASLPGRPLFPTIGVDDLRASLGGPLPAGPSDPVRVLEELAAACDPGIVGNMDGRYFGFVIGGSVPAALGADWLTSVWDQPAGLYMTGPAASVVEEVAGAWLAELLGLPPGVSFAYVTGCQMAHFTCLAAARHRVLRDAGWDAEEDGLAGAPPIRVVCGEKRHVTVDRALRFLGIGSRAIRAIPCDSLGRVDAAALARELKSIGPGPTIVVGQAGEVNTGSFDDLTAVGTAAREAAAWYHVDGAFGLWAAVSPRLAPLLAGHHLADSWATDAHKWLNVPYDSGLAFCADTEAHRAALSVTAAYLIHDPGTRRDEVDWTPEFSRRARGFAVYAAIRSLGRDGIRDMIERCCERAAELGAGLAALPGAELLNDVAINQVLLRFADDATTARVLAAVQASGEAWMSGTTWAGRTAIRVSVSNWQTTPADIRRTVELFAAAAGA
jgi:glutamate/tyrosine decarboxylase-like PLP-dependent enzyme